MVGWMDGQKPKAYPYVCTYLHLNIQNTYPPLLSDILHGLHASPVVVPAELRMLDESVAAHQVEEILFACVIVLPSVLFACSWRARGIWIIIAWWRVSFGVSFRGGDGGGEAYAKSRIQRYPGTQQIVS